MELIDLPELYGDPINIDNIHLKDMIVPSYIINKLNILIEESHEDFHILYGYETIPRIQLFNGGYHINIFESIIGRHSIAFFGGSEIYIYVPVKVFIILKESNVMSRLPEDYFIFDSPDDKERILNLFPNNDRSSYGVN